MVEKLMRFIGTDSLGYQHGKIYRLRIEKVEGFGAEVKGYQIKITRQDGKGRCGYKNIETFLKNWK